MWKTPSANSRSYSSISLTPTPSHSSRSPSTFHGFLALRAVSGGRTTRFQPLRSLPGKRSSQPLGSRSRALFSAGWAWARPETRRGATKAISAVRMWESPGAIFIWSAAVVAALVVLERKYTKAATTAALQIEILSLAPHREGPLDARRVALPGLDRGGQPA